ncbi:MAG: phosphotransferase family protein [Thermomicrobiales bacterium]
MSHGTRDPVAILNELGLNQPDRVTPISGGADTAIWRVEYGDRLLALRVFRADQAAMAAREVVAMAAARNGGLPVPEVVAKGTWHDRPTLLLTWMPGRPLAHALTAQPWQAWALGVAFGRTQATIHRIPAPATLDHPVPWIEWADPDDALRRRLRELTPEFDVLLHLDYHPMNVLVGDGQVTAVLDWANARAGDPRADLARTASILRFAPPGGALPAPVSYAVRRALDAGWRRGYRDVAGPMRDMAPFYAWAGAVMVRDLAPRLGRPDLPWLTLAFLGRVRTWAASWRARAGLPT